MLKFRAVPLLKTSSVVSASLVGPGVTLAAAPGGVAGTSAGPPGLSSMMCIGCVDLSCACVSGTKSSFSFTMKTAATTPS